MSVKDEMWYRENPGADDLYGLHEPREPKEERYHFGMAEHCPVCTERWKKLFDACLK